MLHPYLITFAAVVIWLAAWRPGRAFPWPGLVAWLLPVMVNTLIAIGSSGRWGQAAHRRGAGMESDQGWTVAIRSTVFMLVVGIVTTTLLYLALRIAARELVLSDASTAIPPGCRPRIHL